MRRYLVAPTRCAMSDRLRWLSVRHCASLAAFEPSRDPTLTGWQRFTVRELAAEASAAPSWPPMCPPRPTSLQVGPTTTDASIPPNEQSEPDPVAENAEAAVLLRTPPLSADEPVVRKSFLIGEYGQLYLWMGKVMDAATRLGVAENVTMEWFFTECRVSIAPLSPQALQLARFMNEEELFHASKKNPKTATTVLNMAERSGSKSYLPSSSSDTLLHPTEDGTVTSSALTAASSAQFSLPSFRAESVVFSEAEAEIVATTAEESFCWCLIRDKKRRDAFQQDIYLQWMHRADYLVSRKSRHKKEFRNSMTLEQVFADGANRRKRRQERRELKNEADKARDVRLQGGAGSRADEQAAEGFISDVLPREVREQLDKDSAEAVEELRFGRGQIANSFRTNVFR